MKEDLQINSNTYQLKRYPTTTDKSLRAWSNAELLALDYVKDLEIDTVHLFNDRFGIWNCALSNENVTTIWTYASQQKAIIQNLKLNELPIDVFFKTPLEDLQSVKLALIKIPKSLELFELLLQQVSKASDDNTNVVCCFMTKYFSASFLKIAEKYFDVIEQSRAWKKARLLILKRPRTNLEYKKLINSISWRSSELKQFYGVFSSKGVDIGTQFLLEHLKLDPNVENRVLDLASGNGVIAHHISKEYPNIEINLVDDFNLAVESSRINVTATSVNFVCDNTLESFDDNIFDVVVSNPPFHFEFENNIEVSLSLFKEVKRCLNSSGRFILVANKHLNYSTHLIHLFDNVSVFKSNKRFEILVCC